MRYDHAELVRLVGAAENITLIFMGVATVLGFFGFGLVGVGLGKGTDFGGHTGFLIGGVAGALIAGGVSWLSTLMLRIYLQLALAAGEMSFHTEVLLKLTKARMGIKSASTDGEAGRAVQQPDPPRQAGTVQPKSSQRRPSIADCPECGCPLTPGIDYCEQCGYQS